MSLPKAFASPEEYFEECFDFFTKYKFVLDGMNTDILINNTLDNINIPCLEFLDVYDENFTLHDGINDGFVRDFCMGLERLNVSYGEVKERANSVDLEAPVGTKKKYEVATLAKEVEDLCYIYGCDTVIDIGSGLGYLDQIFYEATGHNVLGLECNLSHYARAVDRQMKYHDRSLKNVIYLHHRVTKNSGQEIEQNLRDYFRNHGAVCITGLHSCGDLAVEGMSVFFKMEDARTLIMMPCCYHKMERRGERFVNFPMSGVLKAVFERRDGEELLGVPFMRLAAHPTHNGRSLEQMVFSLMSRAVLQLYAFTNKCKVSRNRRKAVKVKKCDTFEDYITQAATEGFTLVPNLPIYGDMPISDEDEHHQRINNFDLDKLRALWQSYPQLKFKKAAVYILMQNLMQPVVENFLLYDRLLYLKEMGVQNCEHRKFFNEGQSPRCIALIAAKETT
ncbi:protein RRNAD1-like [Ostrinia furnacalis]|uniref:protein RRNAD1-like n=1 Tax=Ostrinia furnacalis TaxID=93504 RepID=UPI00103A668B|nr:protein RRNAD1-like [Ostrinia furnacalis]